MIRFATSETINLVKYMWKLIFNDSDEYMDMYFTHKYKNENTLIYFEGDIAVASLQILSYTFSFYNEELPVAYLSGVCTLPEYQKRGYASKLIDEAHKIAAQRNIPIVILIPEEEWLFGFYNKYGYEQVFQKDEKVIPLKQILDSSSDLNDAYKKFDLLFRNKSFCIQKSSEDFTAIVLDFISSGYPDKTNVSAMARIIDAERLLNIYAVNNPDRKFKIKVFTDSSSETFNIYNGRVSKSADNDGCSIEVAPRLLCRLLFGYKTNELSELYKDFFPVHSPIINCMLE